MVLISVQNLPGFWGKKDKIDCTPLTKTSQQWNLVEVTCQFNEVKTRNFLFAFI